MVDGSVTASAAGSEPLSKEEALKRFLARKALAAEAQSDVGSDDRPRAKRASDEGVDADKEAAVGDGEDSARRELKRAKQERQDSEQYPVSKHSHFDLVPGHQNTTTKEPMKRYVQAPPRRPAVVPRLDPYVRQSLSLRCLQAPGHAAHYSLGVQG